MLRLALPVLVLLATGFVAWQNLDGDAEFWLLPYVEVLPGVGSDLHARGLATVAILGALGVISLGLQALSWRRARLREGRDQHAMDQAEALREWHEEHAWHHVDAVSPSGARAAREGGRTPDLGG